MKKRIRKFVSCILSMSLFLSMSICMLSAADFDGTATTAWLINTPITTGEKSGGQLVGEDLYLPNRNQPGDINTYYESWGENIYVEDRMIKVVPSVTGPATVTYGESRTVSSSFSGNLSFLIKKAVVDSFAGTAAISISTSKSFTVSVDIAAGRTASIYFIPKMRHTKGTYCYDSFTSYEIDAYIPIKLGSFADGKYVAIYED